MLNFQELPQTLSNAAYNTGNAELPNGTYIGEDGLAHCTRCHGKRQTIINWPGIPKPQTVWCICECMENSINNQKSNSAKCRTERKSISMTPDGVSVPNWRKMDFGNIDYSEKPWNVVLTYSRNFARMKEERVSLLFFGRTGCGKTSAAVSIAQSAEAAGLTALVTTPTRIINDMLGNTTKGKNKLIDSICQFDLVVIDDLGSERNTEYSQEQLFSVIDSLYLSDCLLIVTTNLGLADLKNETEVTKQRIYSRILERCRPVSFPNCDFRQAHKNTAQQRALALFDAKV